MNSENISLFNDKLKGFLALAALEAFAGAVWLLFRPSMAKNALIFGYSAGMLILIAGLLLLGIGLSLTAGVFMRKNTRLATGFQDWLNRQNPAQRFNLLFGLACLSLVGLGLPLVYPRLSAYLYAHVFQIYSYDYVSHADRFLTTVGQIFQRILPYYCLGCLYLIQTIVFLWYSGLPRFKQNNFFSFSRLLRNILLVCLAGLTLFHWLLLYFRLDFFFNLPHWFWKFFDRPTPHALIYPFIGLAILIVGGLLLKKERLTALSALAVLVLGLSLQIGFGFIEGDGYPTLLKNYRDRGRVAIPWRACQETDILYVISGYEDIPCGDSVLATKPPGVLVTYMLMKESAQGFRKGISAPESMDRLTQTIVYVTPLVGILTLLGLLLFSHKIFNSAKAALPALLLLSLPNFSLLLFELDHFLYPLLFTGGMCLAGLVLKKQSPVWACICGIYLYLVVFISFSMLPLVFLVVTWVGLDILYHRLKKPLIAWEMILAFAGGFMSSALFFLLVFKYNFLTRYFYAMQAHRLAKEFSGGLAQIFEALKVNNIEFSAWIGFPIAVLALVGMVWALINLLRRQASPADLFMSAFFITLLLLNFFGQTRSEVARLWLFLTPGVCLCASAAIERLFKRVTPVALVLLFTQLVTIFLTFKYMNLG